MKSFRSIKAKYSRKIHSTISNVGPKKWLAIRDTAIELIAGIAAVAELVTDMIGHIADVRTAASGFAEGLATAA